ncbi:MAG: ferritin-like protein [Acidobacteria bacterium]|nr:ferritin-like protein [Acidobacteriota bacterium]MCA1620382.1 ferritin-like protein [Acidobacteriota bacterium]
MQKETFQRPELKERDPKFKDTDKAALQAVAQAAVDVELFTLPLYMVSMYSIQGMHQITSKGNDFYRGRLWPGASPARDPGSGPNAAAFNHFFSVFIDEMLHLQLASNIAKALGVMPSYTSEALVDKNYGWVCYGPDKTVLPHILDFRDTVEGYDDIKVKLGALTVEQNRLFLAIEQNEDDARGIIDPDKVADYFPPAPFVGWEAGQDLPMFGTIGWMYKCLWRYMEVVYADGTSLFEQVFNRGTLERDLFNASSSYHKPEYPRMPTMASGEVTVRSAMENILNMINAITDQGEGAGVAKWIRQMRGLLQYAPVEGQFRPDEEALNFDYPSYTDTGAQNDPSGQTVARSQNGGLDHHDRFDKINQLLEAGGVVTWDQWHASGKSWTADMLKTNEEDYKANRWTLPPAEDIAAALNNLKGADGTYDVFSQAAAGSIAGITRVLSGFWTDETTGFPSPSMYGSGDRVSICWAVFGKYPDITKGVEAKATGRMYHACQGLDLGGGKSEPTCAEVAVFHSCRGSNTCKTEGGCGFVQVQGQSHQCGQKVLLDHLRPTRPLRGEARASAPLYSAPSDNKCASFGGCAVPISASQLYPEPSPGHEAAYMEVYDFVGQTAEPDKIDLLKFEAGDRVYDIAWQAYVKVLEHRRQPIPDPPKVSDLRLAFPPST